MAKKQVQVIEIDVITKGLDTAQNSFKTMADSGGELGKKSKEILKDIGKARNIMEEYGDEMPIGKAKELQKILEKISNNADDVSQMESVKVFGDKELEKIKKINSQIDEYNNKIKEQRELQKDLAKKRDDRIEKLKTQKTANLTQDDGSKKSVKLDSIQGKWNNKEDLTKLSTSGTAEQQEAAKAVLEQMTKAQEQYSKSLEESKAKIINYEASIGDLKKSKAEVATTTRELTDAEKLAGESTALFAQTQASALNKVIESNQKLGNSAIDTSNKLKKQQTSLGGVVKSLFSWTAAWNLGKKLYQEAVRTIKEMDQALTGMAMVTGQSRDEVDKLIPRIQNLAKETSTAMTEIAGLITEYTKQGRTLEESFILAEETAKAAKIAGISAAESIQYMTSAINGFNLAAKDATHVSDVFANLAAISATDYEQLAIALSKVSAQANTAGMSMEYTTALLAKGIETTQEAPESIGTALKTILARMRELSDYGKTLEDGGSVNKVENALAAAGIELRDVNGQFRDLEQIFDELGPKWDGLNTMQQQAIAQAVAGTRQQSRFVAIMQDWERTQELATEAQDSAGASAAQYAVYAKGMEAAMTNMKTAWQEFTQSLTSSKVIIGLVNTVTKVLDGITGFLEGGGELTKVIFLGISAIVLANKVLAPVRKALGMETDKEKLLELEKLDILRKQAIEHEKLLKQKHKEAELAAKEAKEDLDLAETNRDTQSVNVSKAKKAVADRESEISTHNANYGDEGQFIDPETDPTLISLRKQVEAEEEALRKADELIKKKRDELTSANDLVKQTADQITAAEENTKKATEDYNTALAQSNAPLAQRMQMTINILNNEKEKLKLAQMQAKSEKERVRLQKQEEQLTKRITNLEKKKQKVLTKTNGLFSRMGMTISSSITSGLQSVFGYLGPIGDLLNAGLTSLINWTTETLATASAEFALAKAKKSSNAEDTKGSASKKAKLGITMAEAGAEKVIEETKEEQTKEEEKETVAKVAGTVATGAETVAETGELAVKKKNTAEEKKGLGAKIASAIVSAAKSAAEIPAVGWIIALALLAAAGTAIAVSATANANGNGNGGASDDKVSDKIASQQNTIYETKKKNNELKSSADELEELSNKSVKSAEDEARIKELADNLRGQNEAWKNLSDSQVLEEARQEIAKNNDVISRNIDSNYDLALTMEDLTGAIAKQALTSKMVADQESKITAIAGPDADTDAIGKAAASMAEKYINLNADTLDNQLQTKESHWVNSVVDGVAMAVPALNNITDSITTWSTGGGFWKGMDELFLNGLVSNISEHGFFEGIARSNPIGEFVAGLVDRDQAKKEQELVNAQIEAANNEIVNFAVTMEAAGDDITSQLKAYNELTESSNKMVLSAAKSEYSALDVLSQATKKSGDAAEALGRLSKSGLMSSDALMQIVDAATTVQNGSSEKIDSALNAYENGLTGTSNDGSRSKAVDLDQLRKDLGLSADATINEVKEAYLKKNAKFGKDGQIQYDKNGNIAMKGNNKNRTAIYNALNDMSASLGEFADYTENQLASLKKYKINVDLPSAINNLLTSVDRELGLTANMSEDELAALRDNKEFQAQASHKIMEKGFEMIESMTSQTKQHIQSEQQRIESLQNKLSTLTYGTDEYTNTLNDLNSANEALTPIMQNYNESVAAMTEATLKAAGFMDAATGDEMLTRAASTRDRISDLHDKIGSGDLLSTEDFAFIRDELAPQMHDLFGDFNLGDFYKDLQEGNTKAFSMLEDLYKYQGEATDMAYEKSLATFTVQKAQLRKKYDDLKIGASAEEIKDLENAYQLELQALNDLEQTQKAQQETARKLNNEQLGLSAEELKIQNARTKLERLELDTTSDIVTKYHEKLAAQKILLEDLENSLEKKWTALDKKLNDVQYEDGKTIKDYINIVNGKITIDEKWYNKLSGHQKQAIDDWVEGASEVAEEVADMYQTISEEAQQYFEDQIDRQNELLDAYKSKLEDEQEALQESLDKRRDMYEKYFDALDEQDSDESFEDQQARLQRAIAALSTATDANSLSKLKDYQQQLADLEKEQRQTERDRRRDAVSETLDNQSEAIDQYYEERLENEKALWTEITNMSEMQITDLMTTYNDEYKNATDLNKAYMLLSYKQLHADVMAMMGNTEAASKATADYENYKRWMEKYADDPTIGSYDSAKAYSKGGLVDYTGLAMVHGSTSQPEAFLNASQTAMFSQLAKNLENFYVRSSGFNHEKTDNNNSVVIENFTIEVDATLTDNNVRQTGESLADALLEGLRRTGISVNMKK